MSIQEAPQLSLDFESSDFPAIYLNQNNPVVSAVFPKPSISYFLSAKSFLATPFFRGSVVLRAIELDEVFLAA